MSSKEKKPPVKKKLPKWKYNNGKFDVVKFYETDRTKLFDSIPEIWYANDEKTLCHWPPRSKKSVTLRAMNQEPPEEDWEIITCEVVSEGHATYSIACNIVREKLAQTYNTSSADEHIQAAQFQREHPGLIHNGQKSFEDVFAAKKAQVKENSHSMGSQPSHQSPPVSNNSECGRPESSNKTRESRSHSISNETSYNETHDENGQFSPVHNEPRNCGSEEESRKSRSGSRGNRSDLGINSSEQNEENCQPRSKFSRPKQNHSQSNSNGSTSNNNTTHEGIRQSKTVHTDPLDRRSQSRRSRSRLRRSSSRSHRSTSRNSSSQQSIDGRQLRNIRSQTRSDHTQTRSDHTQSRSDPSLSSCDSDSSQDNNRSRSRSLSMPHSRRRSSDLQSEENCFESGGEYSKTVYDSRKSDNRSSVQKSRTQANNHRSQSGRDRIYRHVSKSRSSTAENPKYRSNHSRFRDVSGKKECNRGVHTQRNEFNSKSGKTKQLKSRTDSSLVSHQTSNKLRVEEMYRLHRLNRTANLSTAPRNSPSSQVHRADRQHLPEIESPSVDRNSNANLLQTLLSKVSDIERIVTKNDRRLVEYDRRLNRLEVTMNKTFIVLGDLSNAVNTRSLIGNTCPREVTPPRGFKMPKLPIRRLKYLDWLNDILDNKDYFNYLVHCEKDFCCCSSSTDTATMTEYLRRFIDVDLRASIVLKDLKGQEGKTLYHDFYNVYLFLIETMKAGYLIKNKIITNKEVHVVLRTVWGRSKQTADEIHKRR